MQRLAIANIIILLLVRFIDIYLIVVASRLQICPIEIYSNNYRICDCLLLKMHIVCVEHHQLMSDALCVCVRALCARQKVIVLEIAT